ncbi:FAD-dependent thymidylate synthase [Candidatus Saccharibacteria bacterium]|nr:FAD-dependent thymidylate synthase [Candidatus Saccharibacteria bacterium]MBI3337977.1 FAD-dependent thymidylate synthase [Candidatus Saccharibacteria bacterium]
MKTESSRNGLMLVIEGTDGSGKGTQFQLLADHLQKEGYDVATFDFPQYEQPSSFFVKEYLNGKYGSAEEVGPYTGSLFYAMDRYQAAPAIKQALTEGKVVLVNRFTGSNMAHQGTKFRHAEERRGYFIWLDNLEFEMLGIPRPDKSIVLRVPAKIAQQLVDKKAERSYTTNKRDIHEADLNHLELAVEVYDDLCQLFPKDFLRIDCVRSEKLMSIATVQDMLWKTIEPLLPPKPKKQTADAALKTTNLSLKIDNPYVEKTNTGYKITTAGEAFLADAVTSTSDNVYAFNDTLSPITIAAAMARLSRRGDDMRITILDEFAGALGKDEKLLQRVITAFGDDSVQQLVGQHVVIEGASNLLTKKLEWGRLASYLEQSTRYIYFDQKDEHGQYKYYTPQNLDQKTTASYNATMDQIFDLYSEMAGKLTAHLQEHSSVPEQERDGAWKSAIRAQACDAVRPVLPVATKSTVGIYASGQALESLIMHLLSDELPEAQVTGQKLLDHGRKVIPTFLERADKPDRGGALIAYRANTYAKVREVTKKYLPDNHAGENEAVQLTSFWPKNELNLIPDMLYEHSNLSLKDIKNEVEKWSIKRKEEAFEAYVGERLNRRHRPGRALEKAHYSWDLICDYGIFRDLQRHRMVDDLQWQFLTPRYGYETPRIIEDAGLAEQFEACFELSLKLYSQLQATGFALEAQYATLLGHKMRWKVTYNAREAFHLHELRTSPQGHSGYRKLILEMHEKLAEVHPLLAEAMKFVNTSEDPELARLAAERYTQFKLSKVS